MQTARVDIVIIIVINTTKCVLKLKQLRDHRQQQQCQLRNATNQDVSVLRKCFADVWLVRIWWKKMYQAMEVAPQWRANKPALIVIARAIKRTIAFAIELRQGAAPSAAFTDQSSLASANSALPVSNWNSRHHTAETARNCCKK